MFDNPGERNVSGKDPAPGLLPVRIYECKRIFCVPGPKPQQPEEHPILAGRLARNEHILPEFPGINNDLCLLERM